ncbi:MAG: hypothetical protein M1830_001757 [Pleopsidium flavum]|nr:MAG: hypothetical protein M1830_001757 [Pleopsidium flavum]
MAKDKERSINPAQAQRKLEKQKTLKKGSLHHHARKAELAARRTEKLARRNPERLQRQIDDLKAAESSGQPLRPRDKKALEELQRDVKAVRKAREAQGEKAPKFGGGAYGGESARRGGGGGGMLGKRRREEDHRESDGSGTDESVRRIPMPRDTPPPIPPQYLRRHDPNNANLQPLGEGRGGERVPHALPSRPEPVVQAQTVYEAKPAVRDLRKEAVSAFVPSVVQRKLGAKRGEGRLLEPEEVDRLEKEGYGGGEGEGEVEDEGSKAHGLGAGMVINAAPVVGKGGAAHGGSDSLEEEEERFERELRSVQMEEVEE